MHMNSRRMFQVSNYVFPFYADACDNAKKLSKTVGNDDGGIVMLLLVIDGDADADAVAMVRVHTCERKCNVKSNFINKNNNDTY